MGKLTKNFTDKEGYRSDTAEEKEIDNYPPIHAWKMMYLTSRMIQQVRDKFGPQRVTSFYRCLELNAAVGSKDTSQHVDGAAIDFKPLEADIKEVYKWIVEESGIDFGQCILEENNGSWWIHMSLPRTERENGEALVIDIDEGERKAYVP